MFAASCAGSSGAPDQPPILIPSTVFVAPTGNDATGAGTREAPFKTIAHALTIKDATEIALAPGQYVEGELGVSKRIAILGPEEGGATITGHVRITADEVVLSRVDVLRGVELSRVRGVVIDHLAIKAGEYDDALAISSSSASLLELVLSCGPETCVQVTTSTITARGVKLTGDGNSKRGLRAETSSVTVHGAELRGTSTNQVLANDRTQMTITDSVFIDAQGTGLNATKNSNLVGDRLRVENASRFGMLFASSRVIVRDSTIGSSAGSGVGVTGGDVDLLNLNVELNQQGALTVSAQGERESLVRLSGGTIRHGNKNAILLNAGDLTINGTRFTGDAKGPTDDGDAILAHGPTAILRVMSATLETPAGFGISITNNASATVTATITGPKVGGVYVEGVAGVPVTIEGTRVERCGSGTGVVVFDSTEVMVSKTRVHACGEAGVLAGQNATVTVRRSGFTNNVQYGLAAFGSATIEVSDSTASGSRWATFATCGDGSSIEDGGGNKFAGPVTTCP